MARKEAPRFRDARDHGPARSAGKARASFISRAFLLACTGILQTRSVAEAPAPEDLRRAPGKQVISSSPPFQAGGVFPHLAAVAGHVPRSECGIGALMPWADRLWFISYVSHKEGTGAGTGLYEIDVSMAIRRRPESIVGTYANRMIHSESNQLLIGPHAIDAEGRVRTFEAFKDHRLTATARHLVDPKEKVYFLTMEGLLFEANVRTLEVSQRSPSIVRK